MFEELDIVRLKKDLPSEGLLAGQTGTVHMLHPAHANYLIEFCDDKGNMLALVSVDAEDLELHWSWKAHLEAHRLVGEKLKLTVDRRE